MTKFFKRCDRHMMLSFFHPVAWYVDARWHKNQFFLASVCIVLAMLVLGLQAVLDLLFGNWMARLIVVPLLGVNLFLYQGWLTRFQKASAWQERNPGALALPHHSFVLYPPQLRFTQVLFSLFLVAMMIPPALALGDMAIMCPGVWLLLISLGMCFAGVMPPPPGARKEKKACGTIGNLRTANAGGAA